MTEPSQLVRDFIAVFEAARVPPAAYLAKEESELLQSIVDDIGGRIMGGYPVGVQRSPEYKASLLAKLDGVLQQAPYISGSFKEYLRRQFESGYDQGMDPQVVRWMGFDSDNGKYGIFGGTREAQEVESAFLNDLPRTIRQIQEIFGPDNESVIYYEELWRRWREDYRGIRKSRKK